MQEISFGFVRQTPSQDDVLFEIKEKYTPQHDIIGLEKVIEELHSYRSSTVLHREVWKFAFDPNEEDQAFQTPTEKG